MLSGASYLARGFGMWRRRPGLMLLGAVPALVVLVVLLGAIVALVWNIEDLVVTLTWFGDDLPTAIRRILRLLLGALLIYAVVMLATVSFTGLTLLVGDPFYERIWRAAEEMLSGVVPEHELGFVASLRDSLRLMALGLLATLLVVVVGLVPVLGPAAALLIGVLASGRLLAAELLGRPLTARGLDRTVRKELLASHRGPVLGFGASTQGLFLIPLGAIVVMPAAVVGATMLAHDLTTAGVARLGPRQDPRGESVTRSAEAR